MELSIHLANGEKIKIHENNTLVGYTYEEDSKISYQKQRAEEFTLIMLIPNWNSLVEFLLAVYCFKVKDNTKQSKIYFSHSVISITFSE